MMKIAITGASGFIGKLLVRKHIELGDDVNILSRDIEKVREFESRVNIFIGNLQDKQSLVDFVQGVDVLYHCAAEIGTESLMKSVNEYGTKNLIEAASGQVKHWIQLSSTGVYGPIKEGIINEKQPYNPINEYERTKLNSDFMVLEAARDKAFTLTIIRPSNVFGYQMSNQSLFQLVKMIDKGFYFFVGPKGASANYVSVENVIEGMYLASKNLIAIDKIYIISDWCTIEEFVNHISIALGKEITKKRLSINLLKFIARATSFIPKNYLTVARVDALSNRAIYSTKKIETDLNYKPIVTMKETIEKLVLFYKGRNF